MRNKIFLGLIILALIMPLASASFQLGNLNSSIPDSYAPGDKITGWINISLANEPENIELKGSLNSITSAGKITDLIDDYTCNPEDCSESYLSTNPQAEKTFSLASGENKILALVFNGKVSDVARVSFTLAITNLKSCINPVKFDIFNDGINEGSIKKTGNDYSCVYGSGTGCFNPSSSTSEVLIGNNPYCEKIALIDSNSFKIGAWIKDSGLVYPQDSLKMSLHSLDGDELSSCNLPQVYANGSLIYCDVNYTNNQRQDFYVCLEAENEAVTKYSTQKEDTNSCGFFGDPSNVPDEYHDYYISAISAKFENIGKIDFNEARYESFVSDIKTYLEDKYSNNCSGKCSVPINITAYGNINVKINNLTLVYSAGAIIAENKLYDAVKQPASISIGFNKIDLGALNISVSSSSGNYTLTFYLGSQEILSKQVTVGNVPVIKSVTPSIVPSGVLTKLTANIQTAGRNISNYKWNFGDGTTLETTTNYASHTYSSLGQYSLTLEITDSDGATYSKIFAITSGSPKSNINSTIKSYKEKISKLSVDIASLSVEYRQEVSSKIDLAGLQEELSSLELEYLSTQNESDYADIMNQLSAMEIPNSLKQSGTSIPFFINPEQVDISLLEEIGAGSLNGSSDDYQKAVAGWAQQNFNMNLDFKYISAYYDSEELRLLSVFKIRVENKNNLDYRIYAVVTNPDSRIIQGTKVIVNSGAASSFDSIPSEIDIIAGDVSAQDLAFYLSPDLAVLQEYISGNVCEGIACISKSWLLPWILWILLFVIAVVAYILLQWWYKVKYENHLFKNRNDIYNMMNFISNAKSQGMKENEIVNGLKKSGWTGEQINYVFKKMDGKAIMPFDFLKLLKKKENRFK